MDTYIVRVWVSAGPEPAKPLRGVVEEVRTGRSAPFAVAGELIAFLEADDRAPADRSRRPPAPTEQEKGER